MTSGVPSLKVAITRCESDGSGCASTCADTRTSGGISRPKKGEDGGNAASDFGAPQLIAPPTVRPPARNRTGIKGWALSRLRSLAANCGPANRSNSPPWVTHWVRSRSSALDNFAISANTTSSGLAGSSVVRSPVKTSAVGEKAFSMKCSGDNSSRPSRSSLSEISATSRRNRLLPVSATVAAPN